MEKIVCRLRYSVFLYIGLSSLAMLLFFVKQNFAALWVTHIIFVLYFMAASYIFAAASNFDLNEKGKISRKEITLSLFWRHFFCGHYDGKIKFSIFFVECFFLIHIVAFILLNILFAVFFFMGRAELKPWTAVWISEMIAQLVLFNIARIFYFVCARLYAKENNSLDPQRVSFRDILKNDLDLSQKIKVVKEKADMVDFLKQYGLHFKHRIYSINRKDVQQVTEVLSKHFPQLYISFSNDAKGTQLLEIYHKKDNELLLQAHIRK